MRHLFILILLGLPLIGPGPASGHELWFEPDGGGLVLFRGHGHEADADSPRHGEADAPCPPGQFLHATVIDSDGGRRVISPGEIFPAVWPADARAVAVTVSSGCWTKTPAGTVNLPRNRVESPLTSWRSFESVKLIRSWDPALALPLGGDLEISPQDDPLRKKIGSKLKVLVTRLGEPAAGAVVTYDGKPRGVTGPDGMINIRLKKSGRQVIGATLTIPLPDEEVDEIVSTAFLEFRLE